MQRVAMSCRSVLVLCALALLAASARAINDARCTHGIAGDLVGHQILVNHTKLFPVHRREYTIPVPPLKGCVLNGVSVRACDMFAPAVEVTVADGAEGEVRVRRLGPRLRPLSFDLTLYCDREGAE